IVDKQRDPERYQQWKDTVLHNILDGGRPVNYNHDFSIQYTVPINKLPFLDWTSLQTAYSTRYDWQAAALTDDSTNFGNVIRNANSLQLNGDLSLTTLYNKSTFLRNLSRPPRPQKGKVVKFETQIEQLVKGKPLIIKHRLKTGDIKATLTSVDGKSVKLGYESIGRNKIRINSSQTLEGSKLFVTGTETSNVGAGNATLRFFMGILMGIKNINIGYSEDKGTTLPGFLPEARWLGQQSFKGTSAPGFNFLFGGQKEHFGLEAAQKGWITSDSSQNNPFLMNASRNIYVRALFEPIKKLRINFTSNWSRSKNSSEYIIYDEGDFYSVNKMLTGNFSMSIIGLKSAFYDVGNNPDASSAIYQEFLDNRKKVSQELAMKRYGSSYNKGDIPLKDANGKLTGFYDGYGPVSQDVLIGAFTRTYGAGSYDGLIPEVWAMRPNWRVAYTGLMDIAFMKKIFKSLTINHNYSCKYNIGSFASNLKYAEDARDEVQNNWMAMFDVNVVSINEQFSPLVSMDMVWANNLTTHWDINRRRDISLSLVNAQLSETSSNEIVIGVGYRFGNIPIFFKNKQLNNDINVQGDFSVRKNNTVIRRISENVDQLTAGQKVVSLKFSADYTFNNRLNLRLFYDRIVNTPYISLSFPTTNTNFGVSVRYTLMQ
ncbi:MAG: cell surface protein SprA, partial [Odoribacter sp.]